MVSASPLPVSLPQPTRRLHPPPGWQAPNGTSGAGRLLHFAALSWDRDGASTASEADARRGSAAAEEREGGGAGPGPSSSAAATAGGGGSGSDDEGEGFGPGHGRRRRRGAGAGAAAAAAVPRAQWAVTLPVGALLDRRSVRTHSNPLSHTPAHPAPKHMRAGMVARSCEIGAVRKYPWDDPDDAIHSLSALFDRPGGGCVCARGEGDRRRVRGRGRERRVGERRRRGGATAAESGGGAFARSGNFPCAAPPLTHQDLRFASCHLARGDDVAHRCRV